MLTSYAQNLEDVILWRALKHVPEGFYIDIGAHDPVVDSVSLAFYEKGWRGIHVEPSASAARNLREARVGEEVLQLAISQDASIIDFFDIEGTGLSTGMSDVAENHRAAGYQVSRTCVPSMPLSSILDRFRDRDIHWMKIDVEGMEEVVIRGWPPSRVRPWIVVVEAIDPNSQAPSFGKWEPALQALGYDFGYFDGINRFYVSRDRPELMGAFGPGPNVLDGFAISGDATSPFCVRVNGLLDACRQQLAHLEREAQARESAHRSQAELLQETISTCNRSRAELEINLSNARSEIESQRDQLIANLHRVARVQSHVAEIQREREGLREARIALQNERDALHAKLFGSETQVAEMRELSHRLWVAADAHKRELEAHLAKHKRWRHFATAVRDLTLAANSTALLRGRKAAHQVLGAGTRFIHRHPRLKSLVRTRCRHWPWLHRKLALLAARHSNNSRARHGQDLRQVSSAKSEFFSASARLVHIRLQTARGHRARDEALAP